MDVTHVVEKPMSQIREFDDMRHENIRLKYMAKCIASLAVTGDINEELLNVMHNELSSSEVKSITIGASHELYRAKAKAAEKHRGDDVNFTSSE